MRKPYPSDLTDDQWVIIEPLIPVNTVGRPRTNDMREVLNAIFYINRAGCQWDMLPHDFPAKSTVFNHFSQWRDDGTWQRILDTLRQKVRVAAERGYDGGKKLWGLKRHIVLDVIGLLLTVVVSSASADDGTFAPEVLSRLTAEHRSRLERIWADGKYNNRHLEEWLEESGAGFKIEVVNRPPGSVGFVKLPRRWVVERTFAWLGRYRRNSRDYEWYPETGEAMIKISSIHRMLRLLSPDKSKEEIPFKYRELPELITG